VRGVVGLAACAAEGWSYERRPLQAEHRHAVIGCTWSNIDIRVLASMARGVELLVFGVGRALKTPT
jgi:hypothetical protein